MHVSNYFADFFLVCFSSVLFIKNTVFFVSESDTSKTIFRRKTLFTVPEISTVKNIETKMTVMCFDGSEGVVTEFWIDVHIGAIEHRFAAYSYLYILTIFRVRHIVALNTVFGVDDKVTSTIF